ncbi:MAG: nicotinamide-nucleotide amidohydrolase family protein [Bacteroidia bacterium]|nr:nicotinamide-nucleotide amidohydrolase family protein [Bacteroidia bacterium]MCX7651975.1 nicotinamide-nucleotide amidohydrolase family protein [Bacteroidia bacterium]MDW8417590.1 nicotinamide-nucleotide amidohydrolase family protein [Bacteroidia bacterium]
MPAPEAQILLIGSELTQGRLVDKNGSFLAQELSQMGFFVREIHILPDDSHLLRSAMKSALKSDSQLVLSSGGLGHTSDDLTIELWAEVLEDRLLLSENILSHLRGLLHARGVTDLPYLERYALVPEKGEALINPVGLAPALYWEKGSKVICALPGPPAELQAIWHATLKQRVQKRFSTQPPLTHTIRTTGISESRLTDLIATWEATLPSTFRLSYNPSWEGVSLHLQAPPDTAPAYFTSFIDTLRETIRPYLYAEGNVSLAEAILHHLKGANLTLAVAESCTGGHLAAEIVNIPGASEVFLGGIVSYSNSAKINLLGVSELTLRTEGAVSETTAIQMAEGVRRAFGAAVGVSTTGIAGPSGGSAEKPVGTVWFGIVTPHTRQAKRYLLSGDRKTIIQRATAIALSLLWQSMQ